MSPHGTDIPRGLIIVPGSTSHDGRFGRMFRRLPPFEPPDGLLGALGKAGGPMQEGGGNQDNDVIPAGFTYLGQFIDHDITFDSTSQFDQDNDPDALHNFRTPRFDLDSVYGQGRNGSPQLFSAQDDDKMKVSKNDAGDLDLPRDSDERALIGDPRNDENILISQMHVAVLKFHNSMVDFLRDNPAKHSAMELPGESLFKTAQRLVRWHYQWVIVHDFLPHVCGQNMVDKVLIDGDEGRKEVKNRFYKPKLRAFMPVEFSVAAYRFGHSQIRPDYQLNDIIFAEIFGPGGRHSLGHLGGSRTLPADWQIKWPLFFKFPNKPAPQPTRKINAKLATPLLKLPGTVVSSSESAARKSLAVRNLLRGKALGLPSGQSVADHMGVTRIKNKDLGLEAEGWEGGAPLWFYVLKEADLKQDGKRLGSVGGRIVAETLLGILAFDGSSYIEHVTSWKPQSPIAKAGGSFTMVEFLKFAGVA